MNNLIDNWYLIVATLCIVAILVLYAKTFFAKPSAEQLEQIRKWLLIAVIKCEASLGSKTGRLKLSMCYDMFIKSMPALAAIVPFDTFTRLVDEALDEMKEILADHPEVLEKVAK